MRLLIALFLLTACGQNSSSDGLPSSSVYAYSDLGTEASVSKITFTEVFGEGRYRVSQAVIRKSDNTVVRANTFCGDFEIQDGAIVVLNAAEKKSYNAEAVIESPYLPEAQAPILHQRESANSALIDTVLSAQPPCFLN